MPLDLSGQKEPVLTPDMSTSQGLELHLNVSTLMRPVLLLEVSEGPEMHLDQWTYSG
jgi:hypothetical protein